MGDAEFETLPWEAEFSASIARAREAAEISQEELARRTREYGLPLNVYNVQDIESGIQPIRLNEALVICKVLQLEFPEVTTTVGARIVTQSYSHALAKATRKWKGVVKDTLVESRKDVKASLEDSETLGSAYRKAMSFAGGEPDPVLDASIKALVKEITSVMNSFNEMDGHLGGALSNPAPKALLPGSQI
jgi:hypothetical protein